MKMRIAMLMAALAGWVIASVPPASAADDVLGFEDSALDPVTEHRLVRFADQDEYERYFNDLFRITEKEGRLWSLMKVTSITFKNPSNDLLDPKDWVWGSRPRPRQSVTGDRRSDDQAAFVKRIGPYVLILFDGRIASIDTRNGLSLRDRIFVSEEEEDEDFDDALPYDAMLVQGDRIIVLGPYASDDDGKRILTFKIDRDTGKLTREHALTISATDEDGAGNYEPRVVGDQLMIYGRFWIDRMREGRNIPSIRLKAGADPAVGQGLASAPLLNIRDIYRPVAHTYQPLLHTLSLCPLSDTPVGQLPTCRTIGLIGPTEAELHVADRNIYLWTAPAQEKQPERSCRSTAQPARVDVATSTIHRLSIDSGAVDVVSISGTPLDQFSMHGRSDALYALAKWQSVRCGPDDEAPVQHVALIDIPAKLFGKSAAPIASPRIRRLPPIHATSIQGKFNGDWAVYAGPGNVSSDADEDSPSTVAVAVPLGAPRKALKLPIAHGLNRLERVGGDMLVYGDLDEDGLGVTPIVLAETAHPGASLRLPGHTDPDEPNYVFDSRADAQGDGLIAIPTQQEEKPEEPLTMSLVSLHDRDRLAFAGDVEMASEEATSTKHEANSYECDSFCWDSGYARLRAIFVEDRVLVLAATDVIEVSMSDGTVRELRRLDLTAPLTR